VVYYALDRLEEALDALLKAVKLKPRRATYHWLLGDVYRALGQFLEAEIHYERAGRLDDYDRDYVARVKQTAGLEEEDECAGQG